MEKIWIKGREALFLLRSDTGDGGWSLHTQAQVDASDATGEAIEALTSGPAVYDSEADRFDRPNNDDLEAAYAKAGKA